MATTETARLERETEETRAQLEQTLGELRARMSPGQLLDQATDYLRNSNGRAFLGNLRDEVVHNPAPVALIGAGIAWLAFSGAMTRRGNGRHGYDAGRDWGRSASTVDDLSHGGDGPSATQRARQTAEHWADDARDAMSDVRDTAGEWTDEARAAANDAGEKLSEGVNEARNRASAMYQRTTGGVRQAARRAAQYGRTMRRAVEPDGALLNFCREQPLLVAGLGVAFGAAMAALIPSSRTERQVMGETSREVRDRVREAASETMRAVAGGSEQPEDRQSENRDTMWRGESWNSKREPGQSEQRPAGAATSDFERGTQQGERAPNIESEPQSRPYAEAASAGPVVSPKIQGDEPKHRT